MAKFVEKEILMIKNPLTGKNINILPMLEFLNSEIFVRNSKGGEAGYALIDLAIKTLVINYGENESVSELKNMTYNLYELRNVFEEMKEI